MGLRIATNIESQAVQRNLEGVNKKMQKSLEQLSSGRRITKSADDAAGLAISTNLKAQTLGLRQAARNANDGISLVQTAEGGLNEVTNILVRLRELTIQSASDTVGDLERGFLDGEFQELTKEVNRISDSTVFNGTHLLNGGNGGVLDFHVGAFSSHDNKIQFDAGATNVASENIGIDTSTVAFKEDALAAIDQVDAAINSVSGQRAKLGAVQSRLMSTSNNLGVQIINQDNARSVIEDSDVAQATSALAAQGVMSSAGIATLSQANNLPNSALRLLG